MEYKAELKDWPYKVKAAVMKGSFLFINHCHQEMEIIFQKKGTLDIVTEEEEIKMKEGDICMIPPFKSHSIVAGSRDCERLVILLDLKIMGNRMEDNDEWIWIQNEIGNLKMFSGYWDEETAAMFRIVINRIFEEYQKKSYAWQLALKTYTNELLLLAVRKMPRYEQERGKEQVSRLKGILEYVALHYCGEITLTDCADHVGFNPTYFSRYFSKCMGITFQEYVKKLRIDKAKWLLMTERSPVTEICYQSGFRDVKTFNKLFKKECGMSPREFRKYMEEEHEKKNA